LTTASTGDDLGGALRLTSEEEGRLKLSRPPSHGKRSREELKNPEEALAAKEQEMARSAKVIDTTESARVLATERLRLQAETAQNRNIVVELDLDGDHFLWANYAWQFVIG
jgi:serine/threonine-protein kinase RIM15